MTLEKIRRKGGIYDWKIGRMERGRWVAMIAIAVLMVDNTPALLGLLILLSLASIERNDNDSHAHELAY